jgi:fructose-1,6-bisphosphatase/inositol monophosphatase family enzyme
MILSDAERRLSGARRAAAAAAEYLVRAFWDDHVVTAKGTYDLHLSADTKAGQAIGKFLGREFPGEFLLEEDGPPDPGTSEWVWIVDPLDGTVNYKHHLPWYCVSVACYHRTEASDHPLWRHGRPVASVVLAPHLNQEFWALAAEGAWEGGRRLAVSTGGLGSGILSVSRGSKAADQRWVRDFLGQVGPEAQKTRNQGAAALDLAYVAQGSLGAHVQRSIQSWDIAAGAHLVLEAGGRFFSEPDPEGGQHVVAGGPGAFARVKEVYGCVSS